MRSLSSEANSRLSDFTALTEICVEISAHIAKLFFENKEKRKSEKLAEEMQICEQYDFFDYETGSEQDDDLPSKGKTENKLNHIKKDY